jgi:DNA-binding response OmpR family regulator
VVTAADGPHALILAQTGTFDVIVLDVILPGLSGFQVLRQLRAERVTTPVLLIAAKDSDRDQAHELELGADACMVKPVSFLVLVAQLRALRRRRDADRARAGGATAPGCVHPRPAHQTTRLRRLESLGIALEAVRRQVEEII